MKNKRHSIKDIAAEIGVSVTTVSFVLNGKAQEKKISKAVIKKDIKFYFVVMKMMMINL